MSLSVLERIARVLVARIEAVQEGDTYSTTVESVVRPKKDDDGTPEDYRVVVHQLDPERDVELDVPGNPPAIAWKQPFAINLFVRPSDHEDIEIDPLINVFECDVVKAVCTPQATWHNFADEDGTLAINAEWGTSARFQTEDGTHEGVTLKMIVTYRTDENNPANVR